MRFDAIVFDFDGVLVESVDVKTQAFAALYSPFGTGVVRRVVDWHLAHGGVSRFEKFRHFHREFLGRELGEAEEHQLGERFSILVEDAVVAAPAVAGAMEFLDENHGVLPLYIASGTPHEEMLRIVARRGMEKFFHGVYGSPAPKEDILRLITTTSGVLPEHVLMVGDSLTDYDGACRAGTAFIGRIIGGTNPFVPSVPVISDLTGLADLL